MRVEIEKAKCVLTESEMEMLVGVIKIGKQCCDTFDNCRGCPFLIGCDECEACIMKGLDNIWYSNQAYCASEETQSQTNHSPCAEEIMRSNY